LFGQLSKTTGGNVLNRRNFLKNTGIAGITLLSLPRLALTKGCSITPSQTAGPFYPLQFPSDCDQNLTQVEGHSTAALGEKILVFGQIMTPNCIPISGAKVEIWQACASGRYNHSFDGNSAPVDPNFQYWAAITTKNDGKYAFLTIKPGSYPVTNEWRRPPHIHFKVTIPDQSQLITQLYFTEETQLNEQDLILQRVPSSQRSLVMTQLKPDASLGVRVGQFNLILGRSQAHHLTPYLG
jgi:protocatechuate 3,4-dioxygenase, beta subunit